MPHQCTNCGHTFADGSKEMLSGCPECGGNKFQFHPGAVPDDAAVDDEDPPEPDGPSGVSSAVGKAAATVRDLVGDDDPRRGAPDPISFDDESAPETEGEDAAAESTGDDPDTDDAPPRADASAATDAAPETGGVESGAAADAAAVADAEPDDAEDAAQASARSEMVSADDLPRDPEESSDAPPSEGRVVKEPDEDEAEPDMEALRQELNDQFESIKVLAPGQYELNLMELYDREEYIIALQENGRYVIEVPETFAGPVGRDDEDA
ncbi:MAG: Zn-ribbon containing protein [Halarchaeum sp.]